MRKYFEGLSLIEGVLLLSAFFFAIFLRFFDLGVQGPWTDELASWFYLRNLNDVFLYESHSPIYYFVLRLFLGANASVESIREFSASLSVLSIISIYFLGQKFLDRPKVIAFVILLCFCPSDIVYSRMARHYSILLEGSLIFLFLLKANVRTWIVCIFAFLLGFVHVFSLIPMSVILLFNFAHERNVRRYLSILLSSFGIVVYYIIRMLYLGPDRVGGNVSWNSSSFIQFLEGTATQFLGSAYPRDLFYQTNIYAACSLLLICGLFFLYRRRESGVMFFAIWISSIVFIELLNLSWINLRVNRYLIYLSGFLIYALVDSLPKLLNRHLLFIYAFSLASIVPLNLVTVYPWDDEVVKEWKMIVNQHPESNQFVCSNRYQSAYYDLKAPLLCRESLENLDFKSPLLFLDLNNNDTFVAFQLMDKMHPSYFKNYTHSKIIHYQPR